MTNTRRSLLASIPSVALGATAAVPALAADPSADATLLRTCVIFHATWSQRERVWGAEGSDEEAEPFTMRIGDLAREIAAMRAATHPGKEAKARVVSLLAPRRADRTILSDGITDDVLWSIVADLTREPHMTVALAPVEPNPDTELIAMCEEFVAIESERCRLLEEGGRLLPGDPREEALDAQLDAISPRLDELEEEIADWTAETPEGLRALAQAARHTLSSDARHGAVDLIHGTEVAWAVLDSVIEMLDAGGIA